MAESVRERLIGSAVELLQRRGVAGTSIADLLERSGVARRSIYIHFPDGKNELITVSVAQAGDRISTFIEELVATQTPPEALSAFVGFWKHLLASSDFEAGCPIAAAAYGGLEAPTARQRAEQVFGRWQELLIFSLVAHGVDETEAAGIATTTIAAIEGAVVLCIAARSTAPLDRVHSQLNRLL
ncbi:TetR/AcrR family transcriptional regulator [Nocardia sp. FBN12]|uniref:TetR/AcrR family transcriptional regulator n=1 Tax=Nocardia sp. FBN12 TaxID=3419766 RepID=UPI003D00FF6E